MVYAAHAYRVQPARANKGRANKGWDLRTLAYRASAYGQGLRDAKAQTAESEAPRPMSHESSAQARPQAFPRMWKPPTSPTNALP